ncbi:MarR family winged helix-turn-helix transcriptional regulator [Frankia sp. CiP3]|uniref:MarR family winged helix-turn-helix transcriptional regulator n=1 Tax=Frankia sp. CiP3 TaxID=2880971 RepID=UPI001EF63ED7|nr:MarR family transcriptional regulator [Frankia sp. CiP3]
MDNEQALDHRALEKIEHELAVLGRRAERFRMAIADDSGPPLDRSAYLLLSYLYDHGSVRLTTLGAVFALDISTVSRQVAALATEGLVERATDPTDRRASLVTLSARGRDRYVVTRAARVTSISGLVSGWEKDERDSFGTLLGRLNAAIAERDRAQMPPRSQDATSRARSRA